LWIAKLIHLTEGLLHSFRRFKLWNEPVVGCRRWLFLLLVFFWANGNNLKYVNNNVEKWLGFLKVKWLRLTDEVNKSVRCSCQIFSIFNIPKIIKIGQFLKSYSRNKKVDVLGTGYLPVKFILWSISPEDVTYYLMNLYQVGFYLWDTVHWRGTSRRWWRLLSTLFTNSFHLHFCWCDRWLCSKKLFVQI